MQAFYYQDFASKRWEKGVAHGAGYPNLNRSRKLKGGTPMPNADHKSPTKIIVATLVIVATVAYLALTGVRDNKSYYVTIGELNAMGSKAYVRHLRVAGNVAPGSIHRVGTYVDFSLLEQGRKLDVSYKGTEPPPDTFKDDAQALADGTYGHDGIFHATQLQAKCASKYAPAAPTATKTAASNAAPALPSTR
jgi:cytochrome c-type biogenesis protein CcmE